MLQSTAENVKDQCLTVVGLADCDALGIPLAASWGPSPSASPFELRLSDRCYAIWMVPFVDAFWFLCLGGTAAAGGISTSGP